MQTGRAGICGYTKKRRAPTGATFLEKEKRKKSASVEAIVDAIMEKT
jgi:hypothetical protein